MAEPLSSADWEALLAALRAAGVADPEAVAGSIPELSGLTNEVLMALPPSVLRMLSLDRLGQFDNSFLLRQLKDIVPKFSNERLGQFGLDDLNPLIKDRERRGALGLPGAFPQEPIVSPSPAPGYSFNPQPREGTTQDLLEGFGGINIPEADAKRLFPFSSEPDFAARNLLRGAGFMVDNANPLTEFLQEEVQRDAMVSRMESILRGGDASDAETLGNAKRILGGGITNATGQALIPQMANMYRQYREKPESLANDAQRAFMETYFGDPTKALNSVSFLSDLAPDLRAAQKRVHQSTLDRFKNQAGANPNWSIFDFLGIR